MKYIVAFFMTLAVTGATLVALFVKHVMDSGMSQILF